MADFYDILGLPRSADSTQIRTAYKRLAMQWHPDRNPGNPKAEELFKAINEAYHILSDPLKKSRYDSRFNSHAAVHNEVLWREVQRQHYARWQRAKKKEYVFDSHYFKIQGLAFLVFLIMSGVCFGIIHTANYFIDAKYEKIQAQNRQLINEVNALFGSGKIDEAINRIISLHEKQPLDFQFIHARDSLITEVRNRAENNFDTQLYQEALPYFRYLKKYEYPSRTETLRKIGVCEYNTGAYPEALQSFKQLHALQPWNLELVYQISMVNATHLNNPQEALDYLTMGTKLFKENLTEIYGEAFTVVMNPADIPDLYASIFLERARIYLNNKNYKAAVKDLNWVIFLRPLWAQPYALRAMAHVRLRAFLTVCSDIDRAKKLGVNGISDLQDKYCR
ncbi:MAG: DnaJ domain-containing protein [Cyclobacteriaceae bacterium]